MVQCGIPDEIQNGYIMNVSSTSFGETAYYQCNGGFDISYPNDPDTRVYCDASGSWQNVPECSCKYFNNISLETINQALDIISSFI